MITSDTCRQPATQQCDIYASSRDWCQKKMVAMEDMEGTSVYEIVLWCKYHRLCCDLMISFIGDYFLDWSFFCFDEKYRSEFPKVWRLADSDFIVINV